MILTPQLQQEIVSAAQDTMRKWYGDQLAQQGACLYWNQCAMRELALRGFKPRLIAGDMLWRIVPGREDDGIHATHWGYEFTPHELFSREAIARGLLPEVHVWCSLGTAEGVVIDLSTAYLPKLAKEHGHEWRTEQPPPYVFGWPPADAYYRPLAEATQYVWRFMLEKFTEEAPWRHPVNDFGKRSKPKTKVIVGSGRATA